MMTLKEAVELKKYFADCICNITIRRKKDPIFLQGCKFGDGIDIVVNSISDSDNYKLFSMTYESPNNILAIYFIEG